MSSYTVRPATMRDAKAVAELHVATWQAAYRGLLPDDHLDKLDAAQRLPYWREAVEYGEPQVFVATEGDKIVGFVGFDRSRDKGSKATTGEIWAMYVSPGHWDTGCGLALWDAAREGLIEEGCTQATLWVWLRNERAMRFFELAGFKRELPSAKTVSVGETRLEEIRLKRPLA